MSPDERMLKLEQKLESKLDANLLATNGLNETINELNITVQLLSQSISNKDEAFKKFENRTEKALDSVFARLKILETDYAAGAIDRETMADTRKTMIKWVVGGILSLILTFGTGLIMLMSQISKINGVG